MFGSFDPFSYWPSACDSGHSTMRFDRINFSLCAFDTAKLRRIWAAAMSTPHAAAALDPASSGQLGGKGRAS